MAMFSYSPKPLGLQALNRFNHFSRHLHLIFVGPWLTLRGTPLVCLSSIVSRHGLSLKNQIPDRM